MFETLYDISLGNRAGILNRFFTIAMLLLLFVQLVRIFRFRLRLARWRYRLHLLEQEAREEGVVTVTDPAVLPPLDAYVRFWDGVPSMAIMFGLLGTFIGLTLSLSEIPVTGDVEAIQKGLSRSIPSMGTAFWTSLAGLVVAIAVRLANAFMSSEFRYKVVQTLMMAEPQIIEGLESAAFQQGQDGALLRPHGIRELLWHQNRFLNQTISRVAPQVSEGIARGLAQIAQGSSTPADLATSHLVDQLASRLQHALADQTRLLSEILEQQKSLLHSLHSDPTRQRPHEPPSAWDHVQTKSRSSPEPHDFSGTVTDIHGVSVQPPDPWKK